MKKSLVIIVFFAICLFIGYKSYSIINKPKQFENVRVTQFIKPDLTGEIETILENKISLKVTKFNALIHNKTNETNNEKNNFKIEYTGEIKNITISSDVKIFRNAINEKRMQQDEISSSDLKIGDILSITYKEDRTTIYKIVVDELTT